MTIVSKLGWVLDQVRPRTAPGEVTAAEEAEAAVILDRRFGFGVPGRRYYLDIRMGRERRTPARLVDEGQRRLPLATLVYCSFGGAFFAMFGFICFAYLLKSLAGINIMDNESAFHPLYMRVFG